MGTGGPGLWGTGPRLIATTLTGPPHRSQAALQAAAASRCKGDPTCRKVPGEKSQGFPSRRASGQEARLEGLDYRSVTPG